MPSSLLIELENIAYMEGGKAILRDISLGLSADEIVTIIGPNGSGKSTLIKIMLGIMQPNQGSLWKREYLKIGYMPQRFSSSPVLPMTARRFLSLQHPNNNSIEEAIALIGIQGLVHKQLHHLSGGEIQQLLLANALMGKPDLLILDEPIQGMDVNAQDHFYGLVEDIRADQGCAIVMVSHDLHMVMRNTDRVICMNHHICCSGTPDDIKENPAYQLLFKDENFRHISLYHHQHHHTHHADGTIKSETTHKDT